MEALRPPPPPATVGPSSRATPPNQRPRKPRWPKRKKADPIQLSPKPGPDPVPILPHPTPPPTSRAAQLDRVLAELEQASARAVPIDPSMLCSLLEICSELGTLSHALRLRRLIPPPLLRTHPSLSSKLVFFYASRGFLEEAHQLFDEMPQRNRTRSAFPWNSLINGYAEAGMHEDALALYFQMEEEGVEPDRFTFPRVLKACTGLGSVSLGVAVHCHAVRSGLGTDGFVLGGLVSLYAKAGDVDRARRILSMIVSPDAATVNAFITGLSRHGLISSAVQVLIQAPADNPRGVSAIITAAPSTQIGASVHGWALRRGLAEDTSVSNALITMYATHGCLQQAHRVFTGMTEKDVVSWNAWIAAHRQDRRAVAIFDEMVAAGVAPDEVTFVSLLDACAKTGMVDEGRWFFAAMKAKFRVRLKVEHLACMVNLLGRAGLVEEAFELVTNMDMEKTPAVWGALLRACSLHGNVAIAEVAAASLMEMEPDNAHNLELLAKVYSDVGRWGEAEEVKNMMAERGLS